MIPLDRLFLPEGPLGWLTVTVVAYAVAQAVATRCRHHALANPVLIAILLVGLLLVATGTDYDAYFDGARFIHFLLGPATVALAVPLYRHAVAIRDNLPACLAALIVGSVTAAGSAVGIAAALGASPVTLISMTAKSVTTPAAIALIEPLGGSAALTAVIVIFTGIFGAITARGLLGLTGLTDERSVGLAHGLSCHAIGTQRCFTLDERMGTFAAFAMGANALITALMLLLVRLLLD